MRAVAVAAFAALLALVPGTGCKLLEMLRPKSPGPAGTGPLEPRDAGQFVTYLNQQAGYLQTIRYDDVSLKVSGPGGWVPRLNDGTLACAKPRNFRLMAGLGLGGTQLDTGSNDREFWMYVKQEGAVFYASHADYEAGKAQLPVPFETDWVLQALGMATYDPALPYRSDPDSRDRVYTLTWDAKAPNGQAVRKVVVFAADRESAGRPQVRKHAVLDAATGKPIASAEIKEVVERTVGTDPATGSPAAVQVPTRVVLEWPPQGFKMELSLAKVQVNERMTDQQFSYFFTRPRIDGAKAIDLATVRFGAETTGRYRGATPGPTEKPRVFNPVKR